VAGRVSDRLGHERVYSIGAVAMAVFAFVYFVMVESGSIALTSVAILLSLVPYALMFAPEPIVIAKVFPTRTRYSGSSLGFNLAGIIGGGPAPPRRDLAGHETRGLRGGLLHRRLRHHRGSRGTDAAALGGAQGGGRGSRPASHGRGEHAVTAGFMGLIGLGSITPIPGTSPHPDSWDFATRSNPVHHPDLTRLALGADESLYPAVLAAAQELVGQGATSVLTTCGYFTPYQDRLSAELPVPVVTSSLMLLPWLERVTSGAILVLAAD